MPITSSQVPTAFETFDKQILTPAAYLKERFDILEDALILFLAESWM